MSVLADYLLSIKRTFRKGHKQEDRILDLFRNKSGIEVGGPTPLFLEQFPIYSLIDKLDGCNFSNTTVWEGNIHEGSNYNYYKNKTGYQYIREASDLINIATGKYDFLLASHCLEHCANPLKAVQEWLRVVKPQGHLLLILPDKRYTFDHNRSVTSFEHILEDFNNNMDEKDLTHLEEILLYHDLSLDTPAGSLENFRQRSLNNFQNRCLHHHVFDFDLLEKIFSFFKVTVISKTFIPPYHQIILGQTPYNVMLIQKK